MPVHYCAICYSKPGNDCPPERRREFKLLSRILYTGMETISQEGHLLITGLRDLSYDDRLKECGLTTLETRRLRGDQIESF